MNKPYQLLLALGIAAASLSSCSRANYAVNATTPASEPVQVAGSPAEAASGTALVTAALPAELVAPAQEAAAALAHRSAPAQATAQVKANTAATTAAAQAAAPQQVLTKAERKALRQELKRHVAASPKEVTAGGKNQYTALFLCIFLGGIGVHQFYLGYTGRGILRIALAITSFLILPFIANLILYIMDIIKISKGTLKPRDGDYATKFKGSSN
ncbi:MAG: TM2 domain-containing protein [Hymenobacter sp.]|nr:MAG: TM2 domain-containing protein [Hymenobacter sp.]